MLLFTVDRCLLLFTVDPVGHNTIGVLQYNLPTALLSQANYIILLQYNCNTIFFFPMQLGSSPNPFLLQFLRNFFFLLSCWKITQKYIYTFFFLTHAIGKIPKNISIHIFFSFLPATGRIKKKIHLFFFHFP